MRCKIDMRGLSQLEKKLLKGVSKDKISQVVRLNTAELTQKAKDRAPVSTEKTNPGGAHGQLKRSIIPSMESGGLAGKVNATVDYAEYVEMGTRFMAAQPYMKPAFDQQKEIFLKDMKKLLMKEL
ncbi:HK97-gp10 family putative phage morphogenesis protein [Faecalibaculum rodentium]|uniref:HK97-gp10 family putative phage morphogenesis protein n=1 Tax=Faecalibaculum rodentium TaxID=1702221 RepID=UPI001F59901B|nr:HK97-gp10 family putative phage morphogenesis protein [Faecalibaculum rodentium]